ncbi:hypothetical protein KIN20_025420 [Parelaphostrongylus tenuis]|uniref:Uncharacterized protein n=1 Tax=Parelaphostrongylus tenuis TaxID=148309 RepID=A0AAD5QXS2_PARTN|nr:hypothetical protein KIN20_025420 [Parelaphostrongylus tenuis]
MNANPSPAYHHDTTNCRVCEREYDRLKHFGIQFYTRSKSHHSEGKSEDNEYIVKKLMHIICDTSSLAEQFCLIPTRIPTHSFNAMHHKQNLIYRALHNYRKMYVDRCRMEAEVPGGERAPKYNAAGKKFKMGHETAETTHNSNSTFGSQTAKERIVHWWSK